MWREKLSRWAANNNGHYEVIIRGYNEGRTFADVTLSIYERRVAHRGEYINGDTTLDLLVDGLLANQTR